MDIDQEKLEGLRSSANIHEEPDVAELVRSTSAQGLLSFDARPKAADFFVIAVPTPVLPSKSADMGLVFEAIESIGQDDINGKIVPLDHLCARHCRNSRTCLSSKGWFFDVVMAPERTAWGNAKEIKENDRIIGGAKDPLEKVVNPISVCQW